MRRLMQALHSGEWVTLHRIRAYSLIMIIGTLLSVIGLVATSHQLVRPDGQPLGSDFSDVYAAGKLALEGKAALAYDWATHHAMQQRIFGANTPFYGWSYPPPFLLIAAALALLPYAAALGVWQGATLALYWGTMRRITQPDAAQYGRLAALGFPAVLINLAHGHNGFLTAFLFGIGLFHLGPRPILAGMLLGALCYKPQFGVLIPLVLMVTGQWRVFAAAAATVIALNIFATLCFGVDIWDGFISSLAPTRSIVLEAGNTGWHKIQSLFSAARNLGASIPLAYGLQGTLGVAVAVFTVRLWLGNAPLAYRAASLISGSLLVTPYLLDYDFMALAPALAFLTIHGLRSGFMPYQKSLLVFVWAMPLFARTVMQATAIPIGFLSVLALFVGCVCWAKLPAAPSVPHHP